MIAWIVDNLANILLCIALLLLVGGISWKLIRDRKKGKTACGCGCQNCAMSGQCHKQDK